MSSVLFTAGLEIGYNQVKSNNAIKALFINIITSITKIHEFDGCSKFYC